MARHKYDPPAEWIKPGAFADFRFIAPGPVTHANRQILSKPWQLGHGAWVVLIEGVSGGVSCEPRFLSPARPVPSGDHPNSSNEEG